MRARRNASKRPAKMRKVSQEGFQSLLLRGGSGQMVFNFIEWLNIKDVL